MIITVEGLPASGKTTLAEYLVRHHGAIRIGEIGQAFLRPDPESVIWYLQRQVDRWTRAIQSDRPDRLIVLDGDPYRPVWFNWIYPERAELPWQEALGFFEDRLAAVSLPRFYLHLMVSTEEQCRREIESVRAEGRSQARAEARFQTHPSVLESQTVFFVALGDAFPGFVYPCDLETLPAAAESILAHTPPEPVDTRVVLEFMKCWLLSNLPRAFNNRP